MTDKITTQKFKCGPYTFYSTLPRRGFSDDQPSWTATLDDKSVPGRFDTLEDAMRAALAASGR